MSEDINKIRKRLYDWFAEREEKAGADLSNQDTVDYIEDTAIHYAELLNKSTVWTDGKPYVQVNGYEPFVRRTSLVPVGLGGEGIVHPSIIDWDKIPLEVILAVKAQEMAEDKGKGLDSMKHGFRPAAAKKYNGMNRRAQKNERGRIIEKLKSRFPRGKSVIKEAIKAIPTADRTGREIALAGYIRPNILCTLYKSKDRRITISQFVNIRPLEEITQETLESKLDLMIKAAQGVSTLHTDGVIHRDIKPGNIFVDPKGEVYVGDFGSIKLHSKTPQGVTISHRTQPSELLLSPAYAPPEALKGLKYENEKSDTFMLAGTFYHWLTGIEPNQAGIESDPAVRHAYVTANAKTRKVLPLQPEYANPRKVFSTLYHEHKQHKIRDWLIGNKKLYKGLQEQIADLQLVIAHGLQKEKEDRPTVHEMLEDLEAVKRNETPQNAINAVQENKLTIDEFLGTAYVSYNSHKSNEKPLVYGNKLKTAAFLLALGGAAAATAYFAPE